MAETTQTFSGASLAEHALTTGLPSANIVHEARLTRAAQRSLGRISPTMRAVLVERLEAIAGQPFAKHNVERIKGEPDAFRLRPGDWRAEYRVDRAAGEMRVLVIEPRGRA